MSGPTKHEQLVETLRRQIRARRLAPGGRLPTVRELAVEHGASIPTVSRALGALVDEGFIVTDGRRGTRVVDHPPHRHRFALVLPARPDQRGRYASLRWQALAGAAAQLGGDQRLRIEPFHALNEHPELAEHQRLLAAMHGGTVAGLVFAAPRRGDAWIDSDGLRVPMIGGPPRAGRPERGELILDQAEFRRVALDRFARRGRRRLAALFDASAHTLDAADRLRAAAADHGLDCPLHRVLAAPLAAPGWARAAVAALMHGPPEDRPDALLIGDDDLLEAADAGLDAAGIAPGAIDVIALASFPLAAPARRPIERLGWDQREFLVTALAALDGWLDRRAPPGHIVLPVRGEDWPYRLPVATPSA